MKQKSSPFKFKLRFDKIATDTAVNHKLRAMGAMHKRNMTTRLSKSGQTDTKVGLKNQFSTKKIIDLQIPESNEQKSVRTMTKNNQQATSSSTNFKNRTMTNFGGRQVNRFRIKLSNPQTQRRFSKNIENYNADLINICQPSYRAEANEVNESTPSNNVSSFRKQKKISIVNIQEFDHRHDLRQFATLNPYPLDHRYIDEYHDQMKSNFDDLSINK